VTPGDAAPDLTFLRPDGTPVRLSAFLDRDFLLVFLRHLA
jgi:peroxiredoxin